MVNKGEVTAVLDCSSAAEITVEFTTQLGGDDLHWEIQGSDSMCSSAHEEYGNMET